MQITLRATWLEVAMCFQLCCQGAPACGTSLGPCPPQRFRAMPFNMAHSHPPHVWVEPGQAQNLLTSEILCRVAISSNPTTRQDKSREIEESNFLLLHLVLHSQDPLCMHQQACACAEGTKGCVNLGIFCTRASEASACTEGRKFSAG